MNAKTIILLILVVSGAQLRAQTVSWAAQNANGLGLADGNSRLPAGNLVRLGTFDVADSNIQTHQSEFTYLNSHFTEYGSVTIGQGFGGNAGHFAASNSGPTESGPNIVGQQIYLWAFDNPTAVSATQYGIFYMNKSNNSAWQFPIQTPVPATTTIDLGELTIGVNHDALAAGATVVLGGFNIGSGKSFDGVSPLFSLTVIPEPSAYAVFFGLLCLGGAVLGKKLRKGLNA
jgi:hypothetical protein